MADTTYCARCGKTLPEGSLKYMVHIQILSDFDGVVPYTEEDLSADIQSLLKNMETISKNICLREAPEESMILSILT